MTSLMVQIFAVVLGAFLLGVLVAWKVRRVAQRRRQEARPTVASSVTEPAPFESTMRFERALSGSSVSASPPVSASGAPMIQVQPRRAPVAPQAAGPAQSRFGTPTTHQPAAKPVQPAAVSPSVPPEPAQSRFGMPTSPSAAPKPASAPPPVSAPAAASSPQPAPTVPVAPAKVQPAAPAPSHSPAASAPIAPGATAPPASANPPPPVREIAGMPMAVAAAVAASTGPGTPVPGDDLTRIRAIDSETARRLRSLGIVRFVDIARWSESDVVRMSQSLGFAGRIEAENWIEQARILASGGKPTSAPRAAGATAAAAPAPQEIRLHRIIGIDPATEKRLIDIGVTSVAEIARWMSSDVEKIEALLGQSGRVGHENWIGQARILMRGGSNVTELRPAPEPRSVPAPTAAEVKPAPLPAAGAVPAPAPVTALAPAPAPLPSPLVQSGGPRAQFAGLRSVRSEALRREPLRASLSAAIPSDDLKRIRGVGVLIEKKLKSLGISSYEQIANWTRADIDRINGILDFKGRIERENWVEQARILATGGYTEFSRRADRGEIETSRSRT